MKARQLGVYWRNVLVCQSQIIVNGLQDVRKLNFTCHFLLAFVPHITMQGRVMLGLRESKSIGLWKLGY